MEEGDKRITITRTRDARRHQFGCALWYRPDAGEIDVRAAVICQGSLNQSVSSAGVLSDQISVMFADSTQCSFSEARHELPVARLATTTVNK